jgi:hypothetical protein
LRNPELVRRQKEYARKIIQETSQYDNVYYEICNEPGLVHPAPCQASLSDIDAWQVEIAHVVREELTRLNRPHLISRQWAGNSMSNQSFSRDVFDILNVHSQRINVDECRIEFLELILIEGINPRCERRGPPHRHTFIMGRQPL